MDSNIPHVLAVRGKPIDGTFCPCVSPSWYHPSQAPRLVCSRGLLTVVNLDPALRVVDVPEAGTPAYRPHSIQGTEAGIPRASNCLPLLGSCGGGAGARILYPFLWVLVKSPTEQHLNIDIDKLPSNITAGYICSPVKPYIPNLCAALIARYDSKAVYVEANLHAQIGGTAVVIQQNGCQADPHCFHCKKKDHSSDSNVPHED
ncbi:hypothetical protein AVEN_273081-1 [Araneus ventricosus]|uniref:Uncharacterized protein n=1 Tax=Araneus ventricosus TaxID=182803 RepID=A0A4Y2REL0_ARAVE|nr:hypothetical protein AVEN_273081-1 [Araneus ventricosus]